MKVVAILIVSCLAGSTLSEILGKFVFHGEHVGESSLSVLHKPPSVGFAPTPGPIPSGEISSVLSLSLGMSVSKDLKWAGLRGTGLFNNPKAVMMLSVEGIPQDKNIFQKKSTTSFPVKMMDENIGEIYKISEGSSIGNHINELYDGKAMVRSVSFKESISTRGFSLGEFSTTSFWNDVSNGWVSISGNAEMFDSFSHHQMLKNLPAILPKGFTYNNENNNIMVNTNDFQFTFNLENKFDYNFFSELAYLMWQSNDILDKSRSNVKDDIPDVYLFCVSTLKDLEQHYGSNSKQMKAAVIVLENVIPKIVADFVSMYGGDIFVVGLETPSSVNMIETHKSDMMTSLKSLKDNEIKNLKDMDSFIPELHVIDEMENSARRSLCDAIKGSIAHFQPFKFKCAHQSRPHRIVAKRSLMADGSNVDQDSLNLASSYDDMFPVIFNIWFWLMVVLFLAVYFISLSLWYMDPGDSIIYRLTQQRIKSD